MEELKNQLGERFPAAVSLMAKAVSRQTGKEVDTAGLLKMMENGQVKSDVLVKFAEVISEEARVGGALAKAMQSTAAQQARFNNSVSTMIEWMSEAGMDEGFGRVFKAFSKIIDENEAGIKRIGAAMNELSYVVEAMVNGFNIALTTFSRFSHAIGVSDTALGGLLLAGLAMLNPFTRLFTIVSGLMYILDDLYVYSQGGVSVFGEWVKGLDALDQTAVGETFTQISNLFTNISESIRLIVEGLATMDFSNTFLTSLNLLNNVLDKLNAAIKWMNTSDTKGEDIATQFRNRSGFTETTGAAFDMLFGGPVNAVVDTVKYKLPIVSGIVKTHDMLQEEERKRFVNARNNMTPAQQAADDVPRIEGNTIQINVDGSKSPEETAKAIEDKLSSLFNITSKAFPEEYA